MNIKLAMQHVPSQTCPSLAHHAKHDFLTGHEGIYKYLQDVDQRRTDSLLYLWIRLFHDTKVGTLEAIQLSHVPKIRLYRLMDPKVGSSVAISS